MCIQVKVYECDLEPYIIYIESLLLRLKNELACVKLAGHPQKLGGHVDDQKRSKYL